MAFRSKAQIGALLILMSAIRLAAAEPLTFQVRHRHAPGGEAGVLRLTEDGIAFEEDGRYAAHSRQWRFQDVEQLTLSSSSLRILTYEDQRWKLGDRQFVFDRLPDNLAAQLYPIFSRRLDQRFVAALADDQVKARWEAPVKLMRWRGGPQGTILVGSDRIVFKTTAPEESRTWRLGDIDNVSSSGPFDLTLTTFERAGANYAGRKDFHFQLKRPMAESDYNALWRDVNRAKGLQILSSYKSQGENQ
jgi:hypothetical protein